MHRKQKLQIIGEMAAAALRMEAAATPKPGLVDRENSGSHRDMDYPLFLVSADALKPYFIKCAKIGEAYGRLQVGIEESFNSGLYIYLNELREAGLEAEHCMFKATGGINTHKGMVFSMGILCSSLAFMSEILNVSIGRIDRIALQNHCRLVASLLLEKGMQSGNTDIDLPASAKTHGEAVLKKTGINGIRKEALSGFDSAFTSGLPALKKARTMGYSPNRALIYTLLFLMTKVEDSNAVYRGGKEGLAFLQQCASKILSQGDLPEEQWLERIREFDRECVVRNLSAGGCADMLAMSIMLYMIFEDYQWFLNSDFKKCCLV